MTHAGLRALSSSFLFSKMVSFQLICYNIYPLIMMVGKCDVSWESRRAYVLLSFCSPFKNSHQESTLHLKLTFFNLHGASLVVIF